MSHIMPALVCKLTTTCNAWIIGSAAAPDVDLAKVRDFDVLVPLAYWQQAAQMIPQDATPNTYGGWKCQSEGREVDVWPEDLGMRMPSAMVKFAWHPYSNARFQRL